MKLVISLKNMFKKINISINCLTSVAVPILKATLNLNTTYLTKLKGKFKIFFFYLFAKLLLLRQFLKIYVNFHDTFPKLKRLYLNGFN